LRCGYIDEGVYLPIRQLLSAFESDLMRQLKRLIQRTLVFGVGAATVWLIAFVFLDIEERSRLPWFLGLFFSYGLAAYVIIPYALRIGLRILHRGRVPSYTLTADGLEGDPVNIVLVGTMAQLRRGFGAAGWSEAESLGLKSSWRMVWTFLLNRPYPNAPFSTLYLFGRGQDIGFQQPIGDSPRKRHHIRFWAMPLARPETALDNPAFWLDADRPAEHENVLWVGAGTKDTGLSLTRLTFQVTHATDADTNAEREFIIAELVRRGVIRGVRLHRLGERLAVGHVNRYITDGDVALAEIVAEMTGAGLT
jgi:hypothetical protein